MKVVAAEEMARIESLAYHKGACEEEFMEYAGIGVALAVKDIIRDSCLSKRVCLLCGKGNNGGDAYVAGTHLLRSGFEVSAYQMGSLKQVKPLVKAASRRFMEAGGEVRELKASDGLRFPSGGLILDGLFGTGFQGKLEGLGARVVAEANASRLPLVAIDVPSGINGTTGAVEGEAILATHTVFMGLPKSGFFFREGWNHVGQLIPVHFGLGDEFVAQAKSSLEMLMPDQVGKWLPPVVRNRHKYQAGSVVGVAGSPGMAGAAKLSGWGALVGGAGLVRLLHPQGMEGELAGRPLELIKQPYLENDWQSLAGAVGGATACFIGPGLGRRPAVREWLSKVVPQLQIPCVLDADALNHLAEYPFSLPRQTILTPHLGEMKRLLGEEERVVVDEAFLLRCSDYARLHQTTVVLKGGPSFILSADGSATVCPRGSPGMATAGSGDVLTGLLAALLAQGVPPREVACLGVYLHAVAGELAEEEKTAYGLLASDLLQYLPHAFKSISTPDCALIRGSIKKILSGGKIEPPKHS